MGCSTCSTGGCTPAGCKSNGSCLTDGGCSKLDVYDWLSDMDLPAHYKPFNIVEVKFKGSRKDFYVNTNNHYLEMGEMVAVEGNQGGFDLGHVSLTGELVRMQMKKKGVKDSAEFKKIIRKASQADIDKWKIAKGLEYETMHKARTLALELNLKMKLSDVDYQGDKTKATFYYTADDRVDFRELIKKMAEAFKIRIEMRQIGMRQEASRLGGIGSCGRELCCSTWLTDFRTVSTAAARYQNLSLNTLKLAGQCGKLKCCLNYELDTYIDALKDIPENVTGLQTERGFARLQKTDIFKKIMWFSYADVTDWIPLEVNKVRELLSMNSKGQKPADLKGLEYTSTVTAPKPVAFDYENVVGQDSLTRLDEKNGKKKKKKKKGKGNSGEGQEPRAAQPVQQQERQQQQNKPQQQERQQQQKRDKEAGQQRPAKPDAQTRPQQNGGGNKNQGNQRRNQNKNNNNQKPTNNNSNKE
ncbi:PSP1 domain-containing protein [Solitalea canadensis]|uniref:Putative PSP1-like protein n=1 Tax=Solitalea canadensis (strain ATCC 29591 / DSM 3403 / JCM 21819 / LMG 8368 / NBRC 15130 / NCIMB 12057 / USAM 9D) TaxID=929556 RepID=H8KL40_SOLCM|nr:regulatory iron-sulfur-containing complex subunit RicT [Solitalea canadensis]AFD09123.1 putative PSP1-like protein [Solitalea canadensis DSM 3403]